LISPLITYFSKTIVKKRKEKKTVDGMVRSIHIINDRRRRRSKRRRKGKEKSWEKRRERKEVMCWKLDEKK
jgi:hypothetical protein